MEVLHGDIRITLSDEEAIRGLERTRAQVKRQMKALSREKAIIKVEGDIKELEKDLILARRQLKKFEGHQAEVKLGLKDGDFNEAIKKQQLKIKAMEGRKIDMQLELKNQARTLAELKALETQVGKVERAQESWEDAQRKAIRTQEKATMATRREGLEIAKLRAEYNKANQALQRLTQTGRLRRAAHPERQMEFDIKSSQLIEQMAVTRAKLKAMNADPIDIPVDVRRSKALERLLGIGDIGMRLGPFTGTLKQFTTAALILGPILTGLLGSVTALAGAIGTGLTGAVGIAATILGGFGLVLGGVGALTVSLFRDFKNLNTLQEAYHKQVLKTGAGSDKAKVKLKEFNHALGVVTPTTRAAFMSLDELQSRWRGLRKQARPDFFNALGSAISMVNANFALFSRETLEAFHVTSEGFQDWMKGLSGGEARGIIFNIMNNTTESIENLLPALGHLGAAFGRVTESFSRHFGPLTDDFESWTESLDRATQNTGRLNTGVDHLVDSFRDVLGVTSAFGRVIIELSQAAMGTGGDFMDDMADGLNSIADTIDRNPRPIQEFFGDSIGTVKALYGVLQPLLQLFLEFSTILRPATNAVLSIIGPIAELTESLAGFGPIRAALQAWATLWLFKRGTAMAVGVLAGSVNALAVALERAGRAGAAGRLTSIGAGLTGGRVAGAAGVGRAAPAVGVAGAPRGAAVAAGGATGFGRAMGGVAKGLGALTTGLLGVSPPVALLGAAAVGATIGLKKLSDRANERASEEENARKLLGRDAVPKPIRATQIGALGMPVAPTGRERHEWEQQRQAALAAADAVEEVNRAVAESGRLQRDLVGLGSSLQNSRLMVEQAEKTYADAVKNSGKKSLEARMALQQLRDARRQEAQATREWASTNETAGDKVRNAVHRAQTEYNKALESGAPFADELAKRLASAKNSAAAFDINVRRAKKGLDIFTGVGSEKIGAIVRQFGNIPGFKRTLVQADTQGAAQKIATLVRDLAAIGQRRAVVRILADAENPKEALKLLNAALDKWEDRHPVAELRADKRQAEKELNSTNKQLSMYGARKPEAALKARDEAQQKLDRLNRQLNQLNGKSATVTANVKFTLPSNFATDAGSGGYGGGGGDGWGVPNIKGGVKNFTERNAKAMSNMFLKSGGMGNAPVKGSGLNAFNSFASRFGVSIGSGFRPGSITSSGNLSYHAMGRARDFPGPPAAMMAFARFMANTFGSRLKELIYTPLGFSIKNGRRTAPYAQADHYDHVHVAMARGGRVNGPTVLYGEEPGHPEYFISTNPRDKKRSISLLGQAAREITGRRAGEGDGAGFAVGGVKADKSQASVIFEAIRIARSLGANRKATRALLMAIMHESRARNLTGGDASSSGILQVLASTGRSMGINPRDKAAVIKAFLKRGYWGKGSAMKLSQNKKLSAAMIAHLVQGNATGTGVYAAESSNADSALRAFARLGGAAGGTGGGGGGTPAEKAVRGAFSNVAIALAKGDARLAAATGTTNNFKDDISAIFGRKYTAQRRVPAGTWGATAIRTPGEWGREGRVVGWQKQVTREQPGLIDTIKKQNAAQRNRLTTINKRLRGKLTPTKRRELLAEKESITGTLSANRSRIRELREQGAEARFERGMRKSGVGARVDIESRVARAASTGTLVDDMAAASAQAKYYLAREAWAKKRGNKEKATEARNAYNSATETLRNLTFQNSENFLSLAESQARLTFTLSDDLTVAKKGLDYWRGRLAEAARRGDIAGMAAATSNIGQYTESVATLSEDIKRLPLERDRALAALTEDLGDDKKATIALRDYWADRLKIAKAAGDNAGIIEAAGNLKSLNDELKAGEESIATQMVLLSEARRDLYKNFGSNFIPTFAAGTPQGTAAHPNSTTINMTVNGASLGDDPHTWSQNVAWELQAAV